MALLELLCILPPGFFGHVTQTMHSIALDGPPLDPLKLRPSTYIIHRHNVSDYSMVAPACLLDLSRIPVAF
ncbi:unnamed protein product [Fusarium graminearum]|uniref:Chromosome 3, complete genome n=1 Tax=Gibberella zeae (strain ATCC MYA-4620 / CBS 123657 / FGSC 9075 / NRRL 31084 / PH-1) TaxID=229533 RepID=A0A098E0R1_GIBZE|nr:unnamed protein product [Fusarium graminearum]CZS84904.1 unnamed protein product [Fusarium graminearum]